MKSDEKEKGLIFSSLYAWCNLNYLIDSLDLSNLNVVSFDDFGNNENEYGISEIDAEASTALLLLILPIEIIKKMPNIDDSNKDFK